MGKDHVGDATAHWDDVDHGIRDLQMKRVVYQLTDDEGGTNEPGGRKVEATVRKTAPQLSTQTDPDTGTRLPQRDAQGRSVSRILFVNAGGTNVIKDAPFDHSREPGTFDTLQPLDAVS